VGPTGPIAATLVKVNAVNVPSENIGLRANVVGVELKVIGISRA